MHLFSFQSIHFLNLFCVVAKHEYIRPQICRPQSSPVQERDLLTFNGAPRIHHQVLQNPNSQVCLCLDSFSDQVPVDSSGYTVALSRTWGQVWQVELCPWGPLLLSWSLLHHMSSCIHMKSRDQKPPADLNFDHTEISIMWHENQQLRRVGG